VDGAVKGSFGFQLAIGCNSAGTSLETIPQVSGKLEQ
jgi:hypothetical protein